jgi:hypothetical protein
MSLRIPVAAPEPDSMTMADASKWYRKAIPLIAEFVDAQLSESERLQEAWNVKSRLRLLAAAALYDQELVMEFFQEFPLPRISDLLELSQSLQNEKPEEAALRILLTVSEHEARAYPATVGESIGMTIHNVNGQTYVMTENGWQVRKEGLKSFYPLLPFPDIVKDIELFHTVSSWSQPPLIAEEPDADSDSPALFVTSNRLWLSYVCDDNTIAVVKFEGHIEHQWSGIDVRTIKNHPYAAPKLEPLTFNEISKSLQTIYWAPLNPKHWVISFPNNTLDVLATSAKVIDTAIHANTALDALQPFISAQSGA